MGGWIINRPRFRLIVALAVVLLVAAGVIAVVVVGNARQSCRSQNHALDALTEVVVAQAGAPHRFNAPIDVARRAALLQTELAKIGTARCQP